MFFQLEEWGPPTLTRCLLRLSHVSFPLHLFFAVLVSNTLGFLSLSLCWVFFTFIFHHRSLAELGFWYAWPPPHKVQAKVVSSRLNPSHGTVYVPRRMWFPQFCLTTAKIWSNRQTNITAACYSSVLFGKRRKTHPWDMRAADPKDSKRREAPLSPGSMWAPLFRCFPFFSLWACPM